DGKRWHHRWLETIRSALRPTPAVSLDYEDRNDMRRQLLASLTIGSIAALAILIALPFESVPPLIEFEPKTRVCALVLTIGIGLTALLCLVLLRARTPRARLGAIAAVVPPLVVALAFGGLEADLLKSEQLLFVARATALTSRLSPLAPL